MQTTLKTALIWLVAIAAGTVLAAIFLGPKAASYTGVAIMMIPISRWIENWRKARFEKK